MRKLSIIAMCLVASVLVACGGGGNGEKYDLYYKLEPGKTYSQVMSVDMDIKQNIMGQKVDMGITMSFGMDYAVIDTLNGMISCNAIFTTIEMGMTTPMGNFSFSSEETSSSVNSMIPVDISGMFRAMKGSAFGLTMTKYGEVKSMTGLEEMIDVMFDSMDLSPSEIAQAKSIMAQSFNEEKMMEQMKNMAIYPTHPVAIGDSWESTMKTDQMDMDNTYTLKSVSDTEVIIEVKSKIKSMRMDNASGTLSGKQEGKTTVHRASGWIKSASIKQKISGTVTMQGMKDEVDMVGNYTISE